jgi:mannose-6-phosphate isomerase-like protein (cupin superfamily)
VPGTVKKSFDSPDETRKPDKTEVQVVDLNGLKVAQMTLQPGWRWSECIKPVVNTESCQIHHEGTLVQGRMHVKHNDGTEIEIGPGDAYVIEPGHDAWVVGDDVVIGFEFDSSAAERFAKM